MPQEYTLLLGKEEEDRKRQWVEKKKEVHEGSEMSKKSTSGEHGDRYQQQKRDWRQRRFINKGHKYLTFPIQASFPNGMTTGVYHKTALDAALGWRSQPGETENQVSALASASSFGHRKQNCLWKKKEWDSASLHPTIQQEPQAMDGPSIPSEHSWNSLSTLLSQKQTHLQTQTLPALRRALQWQEQ